MKNRWAALAAAVLSIASALVAGGARAQTSATMGAAMGAQSGRADGAMIVIPGNGESTAQAAANAAGADVTVVAPSKRAAPVAATKVAFSPATRDAMAVTPVVVQKSAPPASAAAITTVPSPAASTFAAGRSTASARATPPQNPASQDPEAIRALATDFLRQQTTGLPGKVGITVAPSFARGLAACAQLTPFLPPGARLWGRTTVGVRCTGAKPWTLYLQARIAIAGTYYVAARTIAPGEVIGATDLIARDGDLAALPQATVTDASQAIGSTATARITAGLPLRQDLMRVANAVQAGQNVRLVAQGPGFSVSAEGSALSNASPGQPVRVKTAGGQIISGIVRNDGAVEVRL